MKWLMWVLIILVLGVGWFYIGSRSSDDTAERLDSMLDRAEEMTIDISEKAEQRIEGLPKY